MNLLQTIGTHRFLPLKVSSKKKNPQPLELSAVHMPFKVALDSTYHHTTLNPTIKNHSHSQ